MPKHFSIIPAGWLGSIWYLIMGGSKETNYIMREGLKTTIRGIEAFPTFDLHKDKIVGQFVVVCSSAEDKALKAVFYVGKVRALERVATPDESMTMLWY